VRYVLCGAFYIGRMAKSLFAVRFLQGTRQTSLFAVRLKKCTAKIFFAGSFLHHARQKYFFFPFHTPTK
jgi:hypothetical protein